MAHTGHSWPTTFFVLLLSMFVLVSSQPDTQTPSTLAEDEPQREFLHLLSQACDPTCCGSNKESTCSLPCCASCNNIVNLTDLGIPFALPRVEFEVKGLGRLNVLGVLELIDKVLHLQLLFNITCICKRMGHTTDCCNCKKECAYCCMNSTHFKRPSPPFGKENLLPPVVLEDQSGDFLVLRQDLDRKLVQERACFCKNGTWSVTCDDACPFKNSRQLSNRDEL